MSHLPLNPRPRLLALGLDAKLANELGAVLASTRHCADFVPLGWLADKLPSLGAALPAVIFCPARLEVLKPVLDAFAHGALRIPVIVVDLRPDLRSWLDAVDAGAWDYCALSSGAPQLASMLETAMILSRRAA